MRLGLRDRKSTRLNSSHLVISYAVFCLKKKLAEIDYHFLFPRARQLLNLGSNAGARSAHRRLQRCRAPRGRELLRSACVFVFFNDTATTEIYTLSLHDALPIWPCRIETWARLIVAPVEPDGSGVR